MVQDSPFSPGRPVNVTDFAGREEQTKELVRVAAASAHGAFNVAFISGERGIGKSSLAKMVCFLAERDHKMASAYVPLGGVDDLRGLARLTLQAVAQDSANKSWMDATMKALSTYIKKVGAFGVEFELNMPQADLQAIVDNFPSQMDGLRERIGGDRSGLVLVLDDINGLAEKPFFAHWIKSMVDRVAIETRTAPRLFLLFCGLEERRRRLMEHNQSVARVFQPTLYLEPWTDAETRRFLEHGFHKGGLTIPKDKEPMELCIYFSGGLPMLAHEIGDAVWKQATNQENTLEMDTVRKGITAAAENIGRQYLQASVMDALHSKRYRSILRKIGLQRSVSDTFTRAELKIKLNLSSDESKVLNNFIERMRRLGAIISDESREARGVYRFPTPLHRFYFFLAAYQSSIERTSRRTP